LTHARGGVTGLTGSAASATAAKKVSAGADGEALASRAGFSASAGWRAGRCRALVVVITALTEGTGTLALPATSVVGAAGLAVTGRRAKALQLTVLVLTTLARGALARTVPAAAVGRAAARSRVAR